MTSRCLSLLLLAFASAPLFANQYFTIQLVDSVTGRGVPLVELSPQNGNSLVTDSNGIAAFNEANLMNQEVFFGMSSYGYANAGQTLHPTAGGNVQIPIERFNRAERLYRVTGTGIYRDSVFVGASTPINQPLLNANVRGQDSVQTAVYKGQIYWFWGDTLYEQGGFGNFRTSGARSQLPGQGGLDPSQGVNLEYFVNPANGWAKQMMPVAESGAMWIDGVFTVNDDAGNERLFGRNGPPHANHDTLIDEAVEFIKTSNDGPFYVNVWLHETHTPHYPSKELLAHYEELDEQHRVYAAIVEEGDRKVGRILETLRELKLDDNTLVIFSGDNGPEWTGPEQMKQLRDGLGTYYSVGETDGLRGRKRSLFEGGVRTPFIVRWPGVSPDGTKDQSTVIAAVDLLPTLCAAAGVALPGGYQPDGENVLPAFKGKPLARKKPIFWDWRGTDSEPDWWPRLALRDGDWKLLWAPDTERAELYNLVNDFHETQDLAGAEPGRVAQMKQMLAKWRSTLPKSPPADCISKLSTPPSTQ